MDGSLKLYGVRGPLKGRSFDCDPQFRYILGRDPVADEAECFQLDSPTVSRNHAELSFDGESWRIRDLQSFNGIRINKEKTEEGSLQEGDTLDLGEFSFQVRLDFDKNEGEYTPAHSTDRDEKTFNTQKEYRDADEEVTPKRSLSEKVKALWLNLDFDYKLLVALVVTSLIGYSLIFFPLLIQSKETLLQGSFEKARDATAILAERNRSELNDGTHYLLDCDFLRRRPGVERAYILDREAEVVCPVGTRLSNDALNDIALERGRAADDCQQQRPTELGESCSFVHPIRAWDSQLGTQRPVGVARIQYSPRDAIEAAEGIRSLGWGSFGLALLVMALGGWRIRRWIYQGIQSLSEEVHRAYSGTTQRVESIESFAGFDGLVEEVNRVLGKLNQGFSPGSAADHHEAGFLQELLQQVFLLEERAVMAVDHENQFLACSRFLPEVISIDTEGVGKHVTEVIFDPHLQEELMGFLNELSMNAEELEKALSMSDQVVQARGMPIFSNGSHIATILFF